jgi:hypothetical protein
LTALLIAGGLADAADAGVLASGALARPMPSAATAVTVINGAWMNRNFTRPPQTMSYGDMR